MPTVLMAPDFFFPLPPPGLEENRDTPNLVPEEMASTNDGAMSPVALPDQFLPDR